MMQKGFLELLGSLKNSEVSDPQRTKTLVNKKRLKLSTDWSGPGFSDYEAGSCRTSFELIKLEYYSYIEQV